MPPEDTQMHTPGIRNHRRYTTALRLSAAAMSTAFLVAVVYWLLPEQVILAPLWTQVLGWPAALVWRSDPVQRFLGTGRLDNRVWLRVLSGGSLFAALTAPTGMPFLFPVFAALVASVHLQWSGARAWRACTVMTLLLTAALQVPVHAGWQSTPLTGPLNTVATVIILVLSLALTANIAVLAAQRESQGAALEAERRTHHEELLYAATHDVLTGQLNRAGLSTHLAQTSIGAPSDDVPRLAATEHVRTSSRAPSLPAPDVAVPSRATASTTTRSTTPNTTTPNMNGPATALAAAAVLYIDLDDFKPVNDRYGHAVGDRLLRAVALRLAELLRPDDRLARLGGDEFVIVLATGDPSAVQAVAARAAAALQTPFDLGEVEAHISASIGTALSEESSTFDEMLRRADAAMYAAKHHRHHTNGSHLPALGASAPVEDA